MGFKLDYKAITTRVVSTGIIAAFGALGIYLKSIYDKTTFAEAWEVIYSIKVRLFYVLIFFPILWIIFSLFKNGTGRLNRKQKAFLKFNRLDFKNDGIYAKWETKFVKNKPYPIEIVTYCNNHNVPQKLLGGKCTDRSCKNGKQGVYFDSLAIRTTIESHLTHEWEIS